MTQVQVLATFVDRARFEDLSGAAAEQLKIRVLDTLAAGSSARDGHRHALVRQGLGADHHSARQRQWRAASHHRALLHAVRQVDPGEGHRP